MFIPDSRVVPGKFGKKNKRSQFIPYTYTTKIGSMESGIRP